MGTGAEGRWEQARVGEGAQEPQHSQAAEVRRIRGGVKEGGEEKLCVPLCWQGAPWGS